MKGYRTYTALLVTLVGLLGVGKYITEAQIGEVVDILISMAGLISAIKYNYINHKELKELGAR